MKRVGKIDMPQIKSLGLALSNSKKRPSNLFCPKRAEGFYSGEQKPNQQVKKKTNKSMKPTQSIVNVVKHKISIEDPRKTTFTYSKLITIEKIMLMLIVFSFLLSFFKTFSEGKTSNRNFSIQIEYVYILNTFMISNWKFYLDFLMLQKYTCSMELEIYKKATYINQEPLVQKVNTKGTSVIKNLSILYFLKKSDKKIYLLGQIIVFLAMPMPFFHDLKIRILRPLQEGYDQYQANDLLTLITLIRIYKIIEVTLNLSIFCSPRCQRICRQNGHISTYWYSIKCLALQYPLRSITFSYFFSVLVFSYGFRLSEGTLSTSDQFGFDQFSNCLWTTFITMATLGYGDYYPRSILGRGIGCIASVCGIIFSSLLIMFISRYLTMESSEERSLITLKRICLSQERQKYSKQAMSQIIDFITSFKGQTNSNIKKVRMTKLKQQIERVNLSTQKIKKLVDYSIMDEMNRCFQILKDNLKQSSQKQQQIKMALSQIRQQYANMRSQTIRMSFAREVNKILNDDYPQNIESFIYEETQQNIQENNENQSEIPIINIIVPESSQGIECPNQTIIQIIE